MTTCVATATRRPAKATAVPNLATLIRRRRAPSQSYLIDLRICTSLNQSQTDALDELNGVVFHPLAQLIVLGDQISPDSPRTQLVTFHDCTTIVFQEIA
ncbi:hypothetical protein HT585_20720 [Ensifer sp. HO-A22]|uniref:Uncharacterized protein n=1 Tax=Ensifer oleiphilus TaxID=2742698 RepID=A0A7Y6Q8Y3_9HYPH|nr:hypothetical protein [Ensifer oleiphilus]NVD41303.1 hypothetical protein [Ensifer oleiphilus]